MKKIYFIPIIIILLLNLQGCKCKHKAAIELQQKERMIVKPELDVDKKKKNGGNMQFPPAIVYKTKKDYSNFVPVILNDDKSDIISYPDPQDVFYNGKLAYPTPLTDGYWLDNRGINENVAFTNYTYEEYAKLEKAPSKQELMKRIIDKNPLVKLVNCGKRNKFKDEVKELNQIIKNDFKIED